MTPDHDAHADMVIRADLHRATAIPACRSSACQQGKAACPCPTACNVPPREGEELLALDQSDLSWFARAAAVLAAVAAGAVYFVNMPG